jgi:transcriptional regulator with XRE-family HTH domain
MAQPSPLGEYILELCKRNGLSRREAYLAAGLSVETLGTIVRRGKTTRPHPYTLFSIAKALGGSYRHMMYLAGHEEEIDESRLVEADEIAEQIAMLPDGTIREELIASIRAMVQAAHQRAKEQNE